MNNLLVQFFWLLLIYFVIGWPDFYFSRKQGLTEASLEKISPRYSHIRSRYLFFCALWLMLIGIPFIILGAALTSTGYLKDLLWIGLGLGSFGIVQGLFAFIIGIYPRRGLRLRYVFGEGNRVRLLGLVMAFSSMVTMGTIIFIYAA